jgi:hypothetical protein
MLNNRIVILFILFVFSNSFGQEKFRVDYTLVSIYDSQTETWSEWKEGYNTFVINANENNDIFHIKGNGDKVIYRKISDDVEEGDNAKGGHYQIIQALDEDGTVFSFQLFDNPKIGLKIIYSNLMIQFSKE